MLYKRCSRCRRTLPASEFYKQSSSGDGLQRYCKTCKLKHQQNSPGRPAAVKKYREANRELCNARTTANQKKRRAYYTKRVADWRRKNPDRHLASKRAYYARAKARVLEQNYRRKGRIRNDMSRLTPAQQAEVQGLYDFCRIFPGYEVDHIVPLNGEKVCGLHVPWNLQVLPAGENRKKGNKFNDPGEESGAQEMKDGEDAASGVFLPGNKSRRGRGKGGRGRS